MLGILFQKVLSLTDRPCHQSHTERRQEDLGNEQEKTAAALHQPPSPKPTPTPSSEHTRWPLLPVGPSRDQRRPCRRRHFVPPGELLVLPVTLMVLGLCSFEEMQQVKEMRWAKIHQEKPKIKKKKKKQY